MTSPAAARWIALIEAVPVPVATDRASVLLRCIEGRNPGAMAEAIAGLAVFERGGDEGLRAWLSRPIAPANVDTDPQRVIGEALQRAVAVLHATAPGASMQRALGSVERLATRLERVNLGRPKIETEDEREARFKEVRVAMLRKIDAALPEQIEAERRRATT